MPDIEFQSPFRTISLRAGDQSVSKAVSILFIVHNARDGSTRNGTCLLSVHLT